MTKAPHGPSIKDGPHRPISTPAKLPRLRRPTKRVVADFANQEGTLVVVEPVPFADELDHSEDEDLRETEQWKRLHAELVVFYTRLGFVMHPSGLMYLVPEET